MRMHLKLEIKRKDNWIFSNLSLKVRRRKNFMTKKISFLLCVLLMFSLCACSSNKPITDKAEAQKAVESFYAGLVDADPITMDTYYQNELSTSLTRDGDMLEVYNAYDDSTFYSFVEDGTRYIITTSGDVLEDESTYAFYADSIDLTLQMTALGYFNLEDDSVSYTVTPHGDDELEFVVEMKSDEGTATTKTIGKKENGKIVNIVSEIKQGDASSAVEYKFNYDKRIELPAYTMPKTYTNLPHVESPYKTYGEIIDKLGEEDSLSYMLTETELIVIDEYEDRHYQFSSAINQDLVDAYNAIEFDDDYGQKVYDLFRDIEIEDCIDFTDEILSEEQLSGYKTVQDLMDDGFEINGYGFGEDSNIIYADKDGMNYMITVIPTEGFDPEGEYEYDDFGDFEITHIEFNELEHYVLPLR